MRPEIDQKNTRKKNTHTDELKQVHDFYFCRKKIHTYIEIFTYTLQSLHLLHTNTQKKRLKFFGLIFSNINQKCRYLNKNCVFREILFFLKLFFRSWKSKKMIFLLFGKNHFLFRYLNCC